MALAEDLPPNTGSFHVPAIFEEHLFLCIPRLRGIPEFLWEHLLFFASPDCRMACDARGASHRIAACLSAG